MIESNDEPTVGVANRMRLSHTISFKLDVCNHLQSVNGNVTQTAAFFVFEESKSDIIKLVPKYIGGSAIKPQKKIAS